MSDALTTALLGAQYDARENPWGMAAQTIAANAGNLVSPWASPGSNAAASIGAALLAGLLGGVARSQTQDDNARIQPLLSQMLKSTPEQRAEIVKQDSRLSGLAAALNAQALQRQAELEQKQQELQLKNAAELEMLPQKNQLELEAKVAQERALAPLVVSTAGRKAEAEAQARARVEETKNRGNTEIDKTVDSLRKEYAGGKEVDDYRIVERTARAMANTLKDKGATTDLELTRYAILILEPGMAVREGEQSAVLKSAAIPEQWRGQLAKALRGESALTDDVREGLKRLAGRAYNETASQLGRRRDFYIKEAQQRGIDPARIDVLGQPVPVQEVFPGVQLSGVQPSASPTPQQAGSPDLAAQARAILRSRGVAGY